ncbi:hypothetical protein Tco_1176582 [Tanacetum coccineum]
MKSRISTTILMKLSTEAWDQFNESLELLPTSWIFELHQLDTNNNDLNSNDQDSIEFRRVSSSSSTPGISPDVAELKDMVKALLLEKKNQTQALTPVKAVREICYLCSGTLPSNTITNPKVDLKGITTRSGVAYQGPMIPTTSSPPKVMERETEIIKDMVLPTNNGSTKDVQPPVVQVQSQVPNSEPVVDPVSAPMPNPKPSIPYPSRRNDEKRREKANDQALAALGAINKSPVAISVWKKLSLLELTPTCMTLELAERSITKPIGIAEDVYLKVGKFKLSPDFTGRALIDVYEGELTLRVGKEAITFNLDQTSRYSSNYDEMTANRVDVIEMACEEYSQEVLVDAFLAFEDDPTSPEVDDSYYDSEGDILLLESFLNDDPLPLPNQGNYFLEIRKELKICEAKTDKSSIDEPPKVKLKDLPPHLEYSFLEGDNKLPVIISKDLSVEEKVALIKVLKSHKRAIAWKLSDNIKELTP